MSTVEGSNGAGKQAGKEDCVSILSFLIIFCLLDSEMSCPTGPLLMEEKKAAACRDGRKRYKRTKSSPEIQAYVWIFYQTCNLFPQEEW